MHTAALCTTPTAQCDSQRCHFQINQLPVFVSHLPPTRIALIVTAGLGLRTHSNSTTPSTRCTHLLPARTICLGVHPSPMYRCPCANPKPSICLCDQTLLGNTWVKRKWDGPEQFEDEATGKLMMLPTDMVGAHTFRMPTPRCFAIVVLDQVMGQFKQLTCSRHSASASNPDWPTPSSCCSSN